MPFFFWDPTMILLIPAIILSLYAQYKVKSTYSKYSGIKTARGTTGAQAAEYILRSKGLNDVKIEEMPGQLTDHYDPRDKTLRLSSDNFRKSSIAALGVSAHEAGHALQHAASYGPLAMRSAMYPVANFGSTLAFPLILIGFFMSSGWLLDAGIILFSAAVIFTLVTLPVEFDASKRAVAELANGGFLGTDELDGAKKVLNAAALTYVAAAAVSVLQLVRLLLIRNAMDD